MSHDPKHVGLVGPTRAGWLQALVASIEPGSRCLILGPRRAGKTTLLKGIPDIVPGPCQTYRVEAFSPTTTHGIDSLGVFCAAPHRGHLRIALVDDVDCLSASDITSIRGLLRSSPRVAFVLATSTVAGMHDSLVAQCKVMQLMMPRIEDQRCLGGARSRPAAGLSIGGVRRQETACQLIGRDIKWRTRCEAPAIVSAITNKAEATEAIAEAVGLLHSGWSCGDLVETVHAQVVAGRWDTDIAHGVTRTLLRHAAIADKPDCSQASMLLLALELVGVRPMDS